MFDTKWTYMIMHKNELVASIRKDGYCEVYSSSFMPYNLYLETKTQDLDERVNNLTNFYYWCASRVLSLDRKHAKTILNYLNKKQAVTDKDRAEIALSYHCLTLTDVFWVKEKEETLFFEDISLYRNPLSRAFFDVCLRGVYPTSRTQEFLTQGKVAGDISTSGVAPKAWLRKDGYIYLYKDGNADEVNAELLASKIANCFQCNHIEYFEDYYLGEKVCVSKLITSEETSIVPIEYIEVYAINNEIDKYSLVLEKDSYNYYMMNILDYLIGNTDRHWGNWGFLVDNKTNELLNLHPLMDFNKAFTTYDDLAGAKCLTTREARTQMQAAIEAVKQIGLNQISEIQGNWFYDESIKEMFFKRLDVLRKTNDERSKA
ncbi:MAG: hypothetical protein E7340_05910 [Clostridiales bacterium]|nr:hypothetical protein [Clostridiales bacterium]